MTVEEINKVREAIATLSRLTEQDWKDLYFFNKSDNHQAIPDGERICLCLKELGIPANLYGYKYLETAISIVLERPREAKQITKSLYPEVAKKHFTTPTRVERAIRHAIEIAFEKSNEDQIKKILGNGYSFKKEKATNSEFIFGIADHLKRV